jgi:hypothetical protein
MKCPACSVETEGPETCTACGCLLAAGKCRACQADLAAGAKFCPKCSAPVRAMASSIGYWAMGAIALAAVVGFVLSNKPSPEPTAAPAATGAAPRAAKPGPFAIAAPGAAAMPSPEANPEMANLTPRQQADSLFNVVMSAAEQGDQKTVSEALPEALAAYQALGSIDSDGMFHVALMQLTGNDFAGARATADQILAKLPNHLLALSVAAKAAAAAGDAKAAKNYNELLVTSYDTEVVKTLPEYQDHARVLPAQRDEARKALGQ